MKQSFLLFLLAFAAFSETSAQCQNFTLTYGVAGTDQTQGFKIIPTQDSNFVIAGTWNNEAFLLKVNALGQQLAFQKYGAAVTGQSIFYDVVEASDGGFVAVGECENCVVPNDSLTKVIAIKTDANLNLDATIGVKKYGKVTLPGGAVTADEQKSPRIVRAGDSYLLASTIVIGASINWENTLVTKLSGSLSTLWLKSYNAGYFEAPVGIVATGDGFIIPVNRFNWPEASLLKINNNGDQQWIKTYAAASVRNITYLPGSNDVVVVGERLVSNQPKQAFLMRFDAGNGAALDSLLFGSNFDDEGRDVKALPNGGLLVGTVMIQSEIFGDYHTSRIYQIESNPLSVKCFNSITNGESFVGTRLRSLLPTSENGKDYVATGLRGIVVRAFFHARSDCEVAEVSATACPGDSYTLPDGTQVNTPGIYTVTIPASNGCDSVVQTTLNYFPAIPPTLVSVTLCPGETYTLPNGQVVGVAGTYNVTLQASNGCDSVIQTTLNYFSVIPPTLVSVTLCAGETYTLPNGQVVSAAGFYPVTLPASNGCDSVVQTTLNYFPIIPPTLVNATLCPGQTYTLPNGQVVSVAGTYNVTLQASNGCDSVVQTTLNYFPSIPPTLVNATLCPGETYTLPNGQVVGVAGTYSVTLSTSNGCDSVVQTMLNYFPEIPITVEKEFICHDDPANTGIFDVVLTSSNGCDSLVRSIVERLDSISVGSVTIVADNGGANGSISLNSVSGGIPPYQFEWSNGATGPSVGNLPAGIYQATVTDSLGCKAVFSYEVELMIGTNAPSREINFQFYPNPFSSQIQVVLEVENTIPSPYELRLFDVQGRLCRAFSIQEGETQDLPMGDLAAGVYVAQLLEGNKVVAVKRLVKQ